MNIRDAIAASIIRTFVPIIVGVIGGWVIRLGIDIDGITINTYVTAAVGAAYYAIVRFAETRNPRIGVLLGSRKTPVYDTIIEPIIDRTGNIIGNRVRPIVTHPDGTRTLDPRYTELADPDPGVNAPQPLLLPNDHPAD